MSGIMGADVMMGHDAHCANWIRKFREPAAEGEAPAGQRGRREGRRRRGEGGSTPSEEPSASARAANA